MAYIYLNKKTQEKRVFGSIKALSDATGIKIDNLYRVFSRNKETEHKRGDFTIIKTEIERV